MLFKPELIVKILNDKKIVTRKKNIHYYRVGGEYTVQPGRGKKGIAKIRVTRIRQEAIEFKLLEVFPYNEATQESWAYVCSKTNKALQLKTCTNCFRQFPSNVNVFLIDLNTWQYWCWNCYKRRRKR